QPGERRRQDETRDALGPGERGTEGGPAAHRLSDEHRPLRAGVVEHGEEVRSELGRGRRAAGRSEAALVEDEAAEAIAEDRHLLPPGEAVPGRAVEEDEPRGLAVRGTVDFV